MFELEGEYNSAKVFAETVEGACVAQIMGLLNQESAAGSKIRIMPDCHAGAGCVIGTTMTLSGNRQSRGCTVKRFKAATRWRGLPTGARHITVCYDRCIRRRQNTKRAKLR